VLKHEKRLPGRDWKVNFHPEKYSSHGSDWEMPLSGRSRFIGRFSGSHWRPSTDRVRPSQDKGENAQARTAAGLRFAPGVHLGAIADNRVIAAEGQVVKWYRAPTGSDAQLDGR